MSLETSNMPSVPFSSLVIRLGARNSTDIKYQHLIDVGHNACLTPQNMWVSFSKFALGFRPTAGTSVSRISSPSPLQPFPRRNCCGSPHPAEITPKTSASGSFCQKTPQPPHIPPPPPPPFTWSGTPPARLPRALAILAPVLGTLNAESVES